jgi:hypothetical protein
MVAAASAAIATARIAYLADLPSFALMPIPITAVARLLPPALILDGSPS